MYVVCRVHHPICLLYSGGGVPVSVSVYQSLGLNCFIRGPTGHHVVGTYDECESLSQAERKISSSLANFGFRLPAPTL